MSDQTPDGTGATPEQMLDIAESNVMRTLRTLDSVITEIEENRHDTQGKAKTTVADLRRAIQTVFDERTRIAKLHGQDDAEHGIADLDTARAEIRGRLSRLRRCRPDCPFSGRAD